MLYAECCWIIVVMVAGRRRGNLQVRGRVQVAGPPTTATVTWWKHISKSIQQPARNAKMRVLNWQASTTQLKPRSSTACCTRFVFTI